MSIPIDFKWSLHKVKEILSDASSSAAKYKAILEIEKGVMKWVCDENALNIELTNTKIKKKAENFANKFNEKKL